MIEITEKARERGRWKQAYDHVEIIDQMKATDLDTGEQGECFVIYMYMMGSDDSSTDTTEEGSSTNTVNQRRFTDSIYYLKWSTVLKCMQ